jgi:hypothetical protein
MAEGDDHEPGLVRARAISGGFPETGEGDALRIPFLPQIKVHHPDLFYPCASLPLIAGRFIERSRQYFEIRAVKLQKYFSQPDLYGPSQKRRRTPVSRFQVATNTPTAIKNRECDLLSLTFPCFPLLGSWRGLCISTKKCDYFPHPDRPG